MIQLHIIWLVYLSFISLMHCQIMHEIFDKNVLSIHEKVHWFMTFLSYGKIIKLFGGFLKLLRYTNNKKSSRVNYEWMCFLRCHFTLQSIFHNHNWISFESILSSTQRCNVPSNYTLFIPSSYIKLLPLHEPLCP